MRLIVANNLQPSLVGPQQRSPKSRSNLGNNKGPDARSRPPWHISVAAKTTNQASSKCSRQTTTYSSSSLPRKQVQESASPNIPVKKCHWPCFDSRNVPSSLTKSSSGHCSTADGRKFFIILHSKPLFIISANRLNLCKIKLWTICFSGMMMITLWSTRYGLNYMGLDDL